MTGASMVATGIGVLFAEPASATTRTVSNANDGAPGSLREMISHAVPGDTISFAPSLTAVTISNGAIDVTGLVIDGSNAPGLLIDTSGGNGGDPMFTVSSGTLTLEHLEFKPVAPATNGAVLSGDNANVTLDDVVISGSDVVGSRGGAVRLGNSTLAVTDSVFTGNHIRYDQDVDGDSDGGAIWVSSSTSVSITDSRFVGNTAYYDGGAVYIEAAGTVALSGSTFTDSDAGGGAGAVSITSYLTSGQAVVVEDSHFARNAADEGSGGLDVRMAGTGASTVRIEDSTFDDNEGVNGGGARVAVQDGSIALSVDDVEMTSNNAANYGGGLSVSQGSGSSVTVSIADSAFLENAALLAGGGLQITGGAPLVATTITGSTIAGNTGHGSYGGLGGGGAFLRNVDATISTSTLSGNHSRLGAGLRAIGSSVTVSSSTIAGNGAVELGGGVRSSGGGSLVLDRATVTDNDAGTAGGGVNTAATAGLDNTAASLTLQGSIVGGNRSTGSAPDIDASAPTSTYSLVTAPGTTGITATGGNVVGQAPLLGALGDNGGATKTHLPLSGSPAIDAGDPALTSGTDQRGLARRSGPRADIGAVEVQIPVVPVTTVPAVAPPPPSGDASTTPGPGGTRSAVVPTAAGPVTVTVTPPAGSGAPSSAHVDVEQGSTLPANGLKVLATAFEVTLEGGAVGSAKVCFPYSQSDLAAAGLNESALQLFHFLADGTREVITSSLDTVANQICGDTTSFSPFAIGVLGTSRVAGVDAPSTAAALSAETFPTGAPVVYLTTAGGFADALGAGPAAAATGGPTLLVRRGDVPAATQAELARLKPAKIVLVGGTAVIGDAVEAAVAPLAAKVERVAGADRAETAAMLSAATFEPGVGVVYVVNGSGFADGLVAGAAAAANRGPVLLTGRDSVPEATAAELTRLKPAKVVVVGGTAAVSDAVVARLSASRLAGIDRYETAARVAETFATGSPVLAATGGVSADALAAVAAAARTNAAVVLVRPASVPTRLLTALGILKPKAITVVGGTDAVSRNTEANLAKGMGS